MKPTYRKSWAGNLLILSDLTFGPSFTVTQWFTGFGELSFWWIQICIGSPMCRSSFIFPFHQLFPQKVQHGDQSNLASPTSHKRLDSS